MLTNYKPPWGRAGGGAPNVSTVINDNGQFYSNYRTFLLVLLPAISIPGKT